MYAANPHNSRPQLIENNPTVQIFFFLTIGAVSQHAILIFEDRDVTGEFYVGQNSQFCPLKLFSPNSTEDFREAKESHQAALWRDSQQAVVDGLRDSENLIFVGE